MAVAYPLQRGPPKAEKIDAMMAVETAVFVGNQHRDEAGIHVLCRDGKPPASVRRREGAQQDAVAIDDDVRALTRGGKIERTRRVPKMLQGRGDGEAGQRARKKSAALLPKCFT